MAFVNFMTIFTSGDFQNQLNGANMIAEADNLPEGAPLLIFEVDSAAGATNNVTTTNAYRVIDAMFVKSAAAGGGSTGQILETGNAITSAVDLNIAADQARRLVSGTDTINDAEWDIPAGGVQRTVTVTAVTSAADIYIFGTRN